MNRQRKNVHRRRRRRGSRLQGLAVVMLSLLLVVSLTAIAFVVVVVWNDMISVPSLTQVFAREEAVTAPAWIAELPETMPAIGGNVVEQEADDEEIYEPEEPQEPEPTVPSGQESFIIFPFYKEEHAQDYVEFQARHPYFDAETVVWKVNALLHLEFYSYIRFNNDPNPLLVNPSHRLPYGFSPAILVPVCSSTPEMFATPETTAAFQRFRASAIQAGFDLAVVSAYRNAERQRVLFDRQPGDGVVARPYQSEHQTGRALDLWGPIGGLMDSSGPPTPVGIWVRENAHNYGFIVRYTAENTHITGFISEPWHITYVGLPISQYIINNNLSSLEEFVARYPGVGIGEPIPS